jgi:GDPmannose 4,6-dehydratase
VTRKITLALARIKCGLQDCLMLGNLDARRDWGHARDYVEMQWRMLQQDEADDFVIATGQQATVREFVELVAKALDMEITWKNQGLDEEGFDAEGNRIIAISPEFFRPAEVQKLLGSAKKAHEKLGWTASTTLEELAQEMALADLERVRKEQA